MSIATATTTNDRWVRRFRPSPDAAHRLVCFPHAGGSASYYTPVAHALAPELDVLAVQYPGRQDRRAEPCVDDLAVLADQVAEQVEPWLDRPFSFFGHSMGATLAYEVARRLGGRGTGPEVLFASGRRAPSCVRDEHVHLRDDDGVIAEMRALSGTDTALLDDDDVVRMILPALRADYRAIETYRHAPEAGRLDCPVVALTGDADPQVTLVEAGGWEHHTTGTFELRIYPGGHFFLTDHAAAVLAEIRDQISGR